MLTFFIGRKLSKDLKISYQFCIKQNVGISLFHKKYIRICALQTVQYSVAIMSHKINQFHPILANEQLIEHARNGL